MELASAAESLLLLMLLLMLQTGLELEKLQLRQGRTEVAKHRLANWRKDFQIPDSDIAQTLHLETAVAARKRRQELAARTTAATAWKNAHWDRGGEAHK
jgi:hypothetical protein